MEDHQTPAPPDTNKIIEERRTKLKALRDKGVAYPNDFFRTHLAGELTEQHENTDRDTLDLNPVVVTLAGRIMLKRLMGKASFATIQDMSGQIQLYITDSYPGKDQHEAFRHYDIGDIVGVSGVLFKTKKGEEQVFIHGEKDLDVRIKNDRRARQRFHTCHGRPASSDTVYRISLRFE